MKLVAYILWLAVLVVGVIASVMSVTGQSAKTLLAVDLVVIGVAGLITMKAK